MTFAEGRLLPTNSSAIACKRNALITLTKPFLDPATLAMTGRMRRGPKAGRPAQQQGQV